MFTIKKTRKKQQTPKEYTINTLPNLEEPKFKTVSYTTKKAEEDLRPIGDGERTYTYEGSIEIRIDLVALAETYTYRACQGILDPKIEFLEEFCKWEYGKGEKNIPCEKRIENNTLIVTCNVANTYEGKPADKNTALSRIREMYEIYGARRLARRIAENESRWMRDYSNMEEVDINEIPTLTIPTELSITITPKNFKQHPETTEEQALNIVSKTKKQHANNTTNQNTQTT